MALANDSVVYENQPKEPFPKVTGLIILNTFFERYNDRFFKILKLFKFCSKISCVDFHFLVFVSA